MMQSRPPIFHQTPDNGSPLPARYHFPAKGWESFSGRPPRLSFPGRRGLSNASNDPFWEEDGEREPFPGFFS